MARLTVEKSRKRPKTVDKKSFYHRVYLDKLNEGSYRPSIGLDWFPFKCYEVCDMARTIGELEDIKISDGSMHSTLNETVNKLPENVRKSLLNKGLIQDSYKHITVAELEELFFQDNLKERLKSAGKYRSDLTRLLNFMGGKKACLVKVKDLASYRKHLEKSSGATSSKDSYIERAKMMFDFAFDNNWISTKPFNKSIKGFARTRSEKTIELQLKLCTDEVCKTFLDYAYENSIEWSAFCNLVRWVAPRAGEIQILRWEDIKWSSDTPLIEIRGKNTAGLEYWEDIEPRQCLLFKELEPSLKRLREITPEGTKYVFNNILGLDKRLDEFRYPNSKDGKTTRGHRYNTQDSAELFSKFLKEAGVKKVWPKPIHCFRSKRETELIESGLYDSRLVHYMLGHDEAIAKKHYIAKKPSLNKFREAYANASVINRGQSVCDGSARNDLEVLGSYSAEEFDLTESQFERFQAIAADFENEMSIHGAYTVKLINALLQRFLTETCADGVPPSNSNLLLLLNSLLETVSKTAHAEPCLAQDRLPNPFKT